MNSLDSTKERITKTKTCVIIPTYNNSKTLQRVIDGVLCYTSDMIVVNDGSTDTTAQLLKQYNQIKIISIESNKGKGNALRCGFKKALDLGFEYAITIDSDGQHYPDDIPVFLSAFEQEEKPILFIGNRNMEQDGIPKKSSFGNNFSNFWFWFETGIKLEDTQSGYRMYPLHFIPKQFYTNKFEFEIEVIVRTAWKGVPVKNVPIKVLYDPNERVSHFRPFKDFTRISILNTVLVFITLFYIKPRDFYRSFKKKSFKEFIKNEVLQSSDSSIKKSISIALGVFIGIAPFWGFQTLIVLFLATFFRLNKIIAFAGSNISIPPMIPFIIYGSIKIGSYFDSNENKVVFDRCLTLEAVQSNMQHYLIGSFFLASIMSLFFGILSYLVFNFFTTFKNKIK